MRLLSSRTPSHNRAWPLTIWSSHRWSEWSRARLTRCGRLSFMCCARISRHRHSGSTTPVTASPTPSPARRAERWWQPDTVGAPDRAYRLRLRRRPDQRGGTPCSLPRGGSLRPSRPGAHDNRDDRPRLLHRDPRSEGDDSRDLPARFTILFRVEKLFTFLALLVRIHVAVIWRLKVKIHRETSASSRPFGGQTRLTADG